ncbi:hypothetical protein C1645_739574 [Glomus cerebriforme]|uniref:Uncharacterized protein n=1 Tax=Glomus cerebriforme TaxID=658196 RepID=A0A397SPY1_9GLOM|nr:hypothetical protein C1645_739574 [Glomus cerebriforme]
MTQSQLNLLVQECKAKNFSFIIYNTIMDIPTASSFNDLQKIFEILKQSNEPKIQYMVSFFNKYLNLGSIFISEYLDKREIKRNMPNQLYKKVHKIKKKKKEMGGKKEEKEIPKKCQKFVHNDNDYLDINYHENDSIELEEQKITLKEKKLQILSHEAMVRKALAEAESLELANLEKKKELGLNFN